MTRLARSGPAATGGIASRPRTKAPLVRRAELMDAAERLFLQRSVAATSIDDIVVAAGVAKGTFYLYFASKEKLLAALLERYVSSQCASLAAAMNRRPFDDWAGRLHAWVAAAVNDHLDRVALHDVVFHEAQVHARHSESDNPVVVQLAELLGHGAKAGQWRIDDPKLSAVMLFHATHGALEEAVNTSRKVHRKKLIASLVTFFRRAVAAT